MNSRIVVSTAMGRKRRVVALIPRESAGSRGKLA
jgi:hypothetical protein